MYTHYYAPISSIYALLELSSFTLYMSHKQPHKYSIILESTFLVFLLSLLFNFLGPPSSQLPKHALLCLRSCEAYWCICSCFSCFLPIVNYLPLTDLLNTLLFCLFLSCFLASVDSLFLTDLCLIARFSLALLTDFPYTAFVSPPFVLPLVLSHLSLSSLLTHLLNSLLQAPRTFPLFPCCAVSSAPRKSLPPHNPLP